MRLPPYGKMSEEYQARLTAPLSPDWRPGQAIGKREASFAKWREELRDRLAERIWPRFDKKSLSWIGGAEANMVDITRADIDLMITSFQDGQPKIKQQPTSANHGSRHQPHGIHRLCRRRNHSRQTSRDEKSGPHRPSTTARNGRAR